jgi:hypothetical protein
MLTPTPILGLQRWQSTDEFDVNEVNANSDSLDAGVQSRISFHTTAGRPLTNLYAGRLIYDTTIKKVLMWDGDSWERIDQADLIPKPVRGYFITSVKNVTATAWADVANDSAKAITTPKAVLCVYAVKADFTGTGSTTLSVRLGWSGATNGNSYDQMDSGILGAMTSDVAGKREQLTGTVLLLTGTTTFKLQAQRANTTNANSINFAAISLTPVAWGEDIVSGAD